MFGATAIPCATTAWAVAIIRSSSPICSFLKMADEYSKPPHHRTGIKSRRRQDKDEKTVDSMNHNGVTVVGIDVGGELNGFHATALRNSKFAQKKD